MRRWVTLPPFDEKLGDDDDVGERNGDLTASSNQMGTFVFHPTASCINCARVTNGKTAELLYASARWDYYYCYRCMGWFKKYFANEKIILPVKDRATIRCLTWVYTRELEAIYERRRFRQTMEGAWRSLGRYLQRA
jgi:hypothetical protein